MFTDILAFSFICNISQKVLEKVLVDQKSYLKSDEIWINEFIKNFQIANPRFILGLGEYFGRDKDKLRIEAVCSNKFRNKVQGEEYQEVRLTTFLEPTAKLKYAKGIGNSYCNLISYKIMKTIEETNMQTQYTFVHIPKNYNSEEAAHEINQILTAILKS